MSEAARIDRALAGVLPPGTLYAVGGRVRDEVRTRLDGIDRPAKDLDYVVAGLPLSDVVERLQRLGSADVVGAAFAVVKATFGGTTVDVALPRRERSTGVGHRDFSVEWGPDVPLADDLARRDFRMNMLARSVSSGELLDPYGGEEDIRARRIDIVAPAAFAEDPLRMLRACQFAARFEFAISDAALAAMQAAAPLVTSVSPERIRDELVKLLGARRPSLGLELMRVGGVLPYVLPELAEGVDVPQNRFHAYDVYRHGLATLDAASPEDGVLRLAALLHDIGKPRTRTTEDGEALAHFYRHDEVGSEMARGALERLRFSADVTDRVTRLVRHHMYDANPALEPKTLRRFVNRIGLDLLEAQFALRAADIAGSGLPKRGDENERYEARVRAVLAEQPALSVRDLAVSGNDVLEALKRAAVLPAHSRGAPEVGAILSALLERVIDDPRLNDREEQLAFVATAARHMEGNVSRETAR